MLAIQPPGEPQPPALYHPASECALEVWMVCGVATIAERNPVRRFIDSTRGPRDQVVNVGFAPRTRVTARPASVAVSGKHDVADLAPSLVRLSHRSVEMWLLQPELPGRVAPAMATGAQPV
jgi:hypothetical protein